MTSFLRSDRSTPVAIWLAIVAALVLAMVVVGGATRLTDSGLSITEWKPVTGALPPMSDAHWNAEFAKYREIPQYQQVNRGMSLDEFKTIYWWEWAHRFLGRLVGLVYALPFVYFLARREIPKRLILRCVGLLALGGLQGAIGWWMVASGLADRVSVAPERLMVHLGLAFILFATLIWTALDAWRGEARQPLPSPWSALALGLMGLIFIQILLGALVAGNDAGLVYNDWPLMNGTLFPRDYAGDGLWGTLAHSQGAVQLHHRLGGYVLTIAVIWMAISARRTNYVPPPAKRLIMATTHATLLQALLGIATLMLAVPLWLGMLHQLMAAVVLGLATAFAWRIRRV
ncbi:COX15/CtaA family protein [Phenylobacterium sp.]|uniref:COX15/CtaA family protein n=1 Tax=Phenylobacterium sp. TaxID=1871053 RepID=UPI002730E46D|nr:COX15/CtaA family protein [Phenylobacterium sp.]MDP1618378.1 COX15/CtaA family protein [Phenylobacterium sp.]MDP1986498.1 COX15/CtaA family protein [Phenylobacterium sp.]